MRFLFFFLMLTKISWANPEFLQAIYAALDDDHLRLVYADWLEEQGDADRAEFIRNQIEFYNLDIRDDRFEPENLRHIRKLKIRMHELWAKNGYVWGHNASGGAPFHFEQFRRGFPYHTKLLSPPQVEDESDREQKISAILDDLLLKIPTIQSLDLTEFNNSSRVSSLTDPIVVLITPSFKRIKEVRNFNWNTYSNEQISPKHRKKLLELNPNLEVFEVSFGSSESSVINVMNALSFPFMKKLKKLSVRVLNFRQPTLVFPLIAEFLTGSNISEFSLLDGENSVDRFFDEENSEARIGFLRSLTHKLKSLEMQFDQDIIDELTNRAINPNTAEVFEELKYLNIHCHHNESKLNLSALSGIASRLISLTVAKGRSYRSGYFNVTLPKDLGLKMRQLILNYNIFLRLFDTLASSQLTSLGMKKSPWQDIYEDFSRNGTLSVKPNSIQEVVYFDTLPDNPIEEIAKANLLFSKLEYLMVESDKITPELEKIKTGWKIDVATRNLFGREQFVGIKYPACDTIQSQLPQ